MLKAGVQTNIHPQLLSGFHSLHYEDIKHANYLKAQCISNFCVDLFRACQLLKNAPLCSIKTVGPLRLNYVWRTAVSINDTYSSNKCNLICTVYKNDSVSAALYRWTSPVKCCIWTSIFCSCVGSCPTFLPPTMTHFSPHRQPYYTNY